MQKASAGCTLPLVPTVATSARMATLREYHTFLHTDDGDVDVEVLAQKLGVTLAESER